MSEKVFIVFDIETSPIPYDSFSESQQEYLVRGAKTEEEIARKLAEMALTPLTAQIITIGMKVIHPKSLSATSNMKIPQSDMMSYKLINKPIVSSKTERSEAESLNLEEESEFDDIVKKDYRSEEYSEFDKSFFEAGDSCRSIALMLNPKLSDEDEPIVEKIGDTTYYQTSEKNILEKFWRAIEKYRGCTLISFNGRNFDAPFLLLRSAIKEVMPSRNIMDGTKFNYSNHIDLLDELTFYNAATYGATRRFNFDFYTRAFGLVSPKSEGIDGSLVSVFFNNGDYKTIANYCLRDVDATWKLFLRIKDYIYIK